jgi:hypothetical protein
LTSTLSTLSPSQEHAALTSELAAKEALLEHAVAQTAAWQAQVSDLVAAHTAADALREA